MTADERLNIVDQERIKQYLVTAKHLNEDQRQAMIRGIPFIGMTYQEATISLTLVDWLGKINGKTLKAQFRNGANQHYILFFDYSAPNRLKMWSAFTSEEFDDINKFRDVRPLFPITSFFRR